MGPELTDAKRDERVADRLAIIQVTGTRPRRVARRRAIWLNRRHDFGDSMDRAQRA